jgi:hypothetical protein
MQGDVMDSTVPVQVGPTWQRMILVLLGLVEILALLAIPAGVGSVATFTILTVVAVAVSLSAPGNGTYKRVVVGLSAGLLTVALVVALIV